MNLVEWINNKIKALFFIFQKIGNALAPRRKLVLVSRDVTPEQLEDLRERLSFYLPEFAGEGLEVVSRWPWRATFSIYPILLFGDPDTITAHVKKLRSGTYDVDYRRTPYDAWNWIALANFFSYENTDLEEAKKRFTEYVKTLKGQGLERSYIFGTGPSLEKASGRDWSDGYRIVCNTIVRDPILWSHLRPHFIVAGDAIYHFGHTSFAKAFRRDLAARLQETGTFFVYPSIFDPVVRRELHYLSDQLVPVPISNHQKVNVDLTAEYALPGLGNVLSLLLLPLGCTLAKTVCMWGFDGKAPGDKLFWSNSNRHTYPEYLPELQKSHPCFFDHHVPSNDPYRYIRQVHGDELEESLCVAERQGYRFIMLHPSWTPTLQKRFSSQACPIG